MSVARPMDLISILHTRIDVLPVGEYSPGLQAVLQHIEAAAGHLSRGSAQRDETAFTDAIYRTNQAFEGSLKEAYHVLTGKDPLKLRPLDIETFLQEQRLLRPRVLAQVSNYRRAWRNASTHDYRLDFDEDEALLAIVTVCAFAIVLIDPIVEKLNFSAAKAATYPAVSLDSARKPLADVVAEVVPSFHIPTNTLKLERGAWRAGRAELVGALAGYLSSAILGADVELQPRFDSDSPTGPDLLVKLGDKRLLVDVRAAFRAPYLDIQRQALIEGLSRDMTLSGIKEALLYIYSQDPDVELTRDEHLLPGADARVVILAPRREKKASG